MIIRGMAEAPRVQLRLARFYEFMTHEFVFPDMGGGKDLEDGAGCKEICGGPSASIGKIRSN